MSGPLVLGVPSKGRLMDDALACLARASLAVSKPGEARAYRGGIAGEPAIDVAFLSAAEIAQQLRAGRVHLGVTGEDLAREHVPDAEERLTFLKPLGFGRAQVVVAVPACWLDVWHMSDLEEIGPAFRQAHGRTLRVATKYVNLARRFFSQRGVSGYRIVESLGATEGTPAAGTAEVVVDITTSGATLRANHLRVLDDGLILSSQAWLMASRAAAWDDETIALRDRIAARIGG